jgi:predicted nucleotidyltransferase
VKRAEATRRLEELVARVAADDDPFLRRITEVAVFGSYAAGATWVNDVDLHVQYAVDRELSERLVSLLAQSRDPESGFSMALRGRQRVFQIHYNSREQLAKQLPAFEPFVLWRRGNTIDQALARVHGIRENPEAGRATRDPVIPELEGLDRRIPRPHRNAVTELARAGKIAVERIELADGRPAAQTAALIESRWGETNPMRRAALAAAAWLEQRGAKSLQPRRHGQAVLVDESGRVAVGIGGKGLAEAIEFVRERRGRLWVEVVNPSRLAPLIALVIRRPH